MSLVALWFVLMILYAVIYISVCKKNLEKLDILPIFIYNGKAYWKDNESIYRCNIIDGQMDLKQSEHVDPINLYDIDQIDYLLITQELEDMDQ